MLFFTRSRQKLQNDPLYATCRPKSLWLAGECENTLQMKGEQATDSLKSSLQELICQCSVSAAPEPFKKNLLLQVENTQSKSKSLMQWVFYLSWIHHNL